MSFKSGFVSIVGRPNVGKSTLLNQILKTKLAIMSDVAQTTRNTIQGIYTDDEAQIIFMDTPGIHKPQDGLGNFMNTTALNSIYGVDMVLFIAPANETIGRGDRFIIERLKEADGPVFLLLNKCDLVSKDEVIKKLTEWKELFDFKEIIPISALEDQNAVSYTHLAGAVLAGVIEPPSASPVILEDDVLIGANAVVIEGVHIGKGAVVGAGSIVTQDVPAGAVVVGNPARIIKEQKDEKTEGKTQLMDDLRKI